jgi:Protein of unknown function (DUF2971).
MSKIDMLASTANFLKRHNIQKCAFPFPDKFDPLLVDVFEDVDLSNQDLSGISFKFRKVDGDFDCSNCNLTSLDFAPDFVGGNFDCSNNNLASLDNAPDWVNGDFDCSDNQITSQRSRSLYIGGNFYCHGTSLAASMSKVIPINIKGEIFSYLHIETSKFTTIGNIIIRGKIFREYPKKFHVEIFNEQWQAHKKLLLSEMLTKKTIPNYLYQYTDVDSAIKIIKSGKLKFTSPAKFNDPYDCNTPIDITDPKSAEFDEKVEKWSFSNGIPPILISNFKERLKRDPEFIQKAAKTIINNIGICCFSTLEDSILMWSHYADYHRGVCLKFNVYEDQDLFLTPFKVNYSRIMPRFDFFRQEPNQITELIRTKFTDWSYESEVRILKSNLEIQNNKKINATNDEGARLFNFNNNALVEVIFGVETSEENIKIIKKLCEKSDKNHVKFYKMELKKGTHYGLEKKDLNEVKNEN